METIIATTDLSANSRAGMQYAIHLARQRNAALVFLHVHYVLRASGWSDETYNGYVRQTEAELQSEFSDFVTAAYQTAGLEPGHMQLKLINHYDTVETITAFAEHSKASYICISTRGAGRLRKLFGTNTGKLIGKSSVPVISVPSNYSFKPVETLLYASDMTDYEAELKKVVAFAKPLQTKVELLHINYPWELVVDKELAEASLERKLDYPIHLHYQGRNIEQALLEQISDAMKATNPDLLVMFTNQERSLFERLFLSSKAEEYSFGAKVPLLCFRKEVTAKL